MTDAEKDAAWRSLPAKIKEQFATDYANALQAHSFDPNNPRIDAHIKFLEECFGKHNLTATEEEPMRTDIDGKFHPGDKVVATGCCPLYGKGWVGTVVQCHESDVDVAFGMIVVPHVALCDLEHFTGQESKKVEHVDFSLSLLQNRKNLTENDISSVSKETAEDLSNLMDEVNNFIERNRTSQVDWLAYRMVLAKAITPKVISAVSDNGVSSDFCESVIDKVATIVDGIVERLKGGDK